VPSTEELIRDLVGIIQQQLAKPDAPLKSIVQDAARLADVCRDQEHRTLFRAHLDGHPPKLPPLGVPNPYRWNIANAFRSDRMSAGEVLERSLEEIEQHMQVLQKAQQNLTFRIGTLPRQSPLLDPLYGYTAVFARIHERVVRYVKQVEATYLNKLDIGDAVIAEPARKQGNKIFIGHGRSPLWRELKDFIQDRLHLEWEEFNREPPAGQSTVDRLKEMLDSSNFALLVMTAEDEYADQSKHARENVIHEIGLFQGRLEFEKAIVLLEEGCTEFSNIRGLNQIHFPKDMIKASFEEVRRVLERRGILRQ
jgi:predicted nucleotide-binding protein